MEKRNLRWLTIIIPVVFAGIILAIADLIFDERIFFAEIFFVLIFVSAGAIFFSNWVFVMINQRETEIERRAFQLETLNAAAISLITELDMGLVLQKVVDLSRELVASRYGALAVLNEDGEGVEQFITSGISSEERKSIGSAPVGKGILGILMHKGQSLNLENIKNHEDSQGFPENHPDMSSLLGVPIRTMGKVIGDLYLADKLPPNNDIGGGAIPYTDDDKKTLEMFATQAAIAIENARLYRQIQQLAVLEERQRFGMDLHDGVIQSIYAVGLMLEDIQRRIDFDPESAKEGISTAIRSLNTAISDIRNYILDLRPQHFKGRDVLQGVEELARALRANTFMSVRVDIKDVDSRRLSPGQTVEILHIAQEALSNIQKHARATDVDILLKFEDRELILEILDNGISIEPSTLQKTKGNGLRNMHERTLSLGGTIEIAQREIGGTKVVLIAPIG